MCVLARSYIYNKYECLICCSLGWGIYHSYRRHRRTKQNQSQGRRGFFCLRTLCPLRYSSSTIQSLSWDWLSSSPLTHSLALANVRKLEANDLLILVPPHPIPIVRWRKVVTIITNRFIVCLSSRSFSSHASRRSRPDGIIIRILQVLLNYYYTYKPENASREKVKRFLKLFKGNIAKVCPGVCHAPRSVFLIT